MEKTERQSKQIINIRQPTPNNQEPTTTAERDTQQSTGRFTTNPTSRQPTTNNNHGQGPLTIYSGRYIRQPTPTNNKQLSLTGTPNNLCTVGTFTTNPITNNKQQPPTGTTKHSTVATLQPTRQPTTNNNHRQGHSTIYSGHFITNPQQTTNNNHPINLQ